MNEKSNGRRVAQAGTGNERILFVKLPTVTLSYGGGDTTLSVAGVGFPKLGLRQYDDRALFGGVKGKGQASKAASDDDRVKVLRWHAKIMTKERTRRPG